MGLQYAQQRSLQFQGHIPNFIKKQCTAICQFKFSRMSILFCTGKSSTFISEQFAFDKILWNRAAVNGYKGLFFSAAGIVNRLGQ